MGKANFLFFPFISVVEIITEHLHNAPSPSVGVSLQLFLSTCLPDNRTMYYLFYDQCAQGNRF